MRALIINRFRFVRLLMENGVTLSKFLTAERMIKLYNCVNPNDPGKAIVNEMLLNEKKVTTRRHSLPFQCTAISLLLVS